MAERALYRIVVEKGPCTGVELPLGPGQRLTIGRRAGADLVLGGDEFVSPDHAEVQCTDAGLTLRNRSENGTLLNGRPVAEARLAAGDRVAIGLLHLITVRGTAPMPAARLTGSSAAASKDVRSVRAKAGARASRRPLVPWWLIAYLVMVTGAAVFLGVLKLRGSSAPDLAAIQQQEQSYATARQLPAPETDRLMRLLLTASVHERRGDLRSAFEAYREVLGARRPVDPRSPAYRYAALRLAGLKNQ